MVEAEASTEERRVGENRSTFTRLAIDSWVFAAPVVREDGSKGLLELYQISGTAIKRHRKIKGEFNPFDPTWEQYGEQLRQDRMWDSMRYRKQWATLYMSQGGLCAHCGWALTDETGWHDHHLEYRMHGGYRRVCPTGFCFTRTATSRCTLVNIVVTKPVLSLTRSFVCRLELYAGKLARTVLRGPLFRKEGGLPYQRVSDTVYGTGAAVTAYLCAPIYHSAAMSYVVHFCTLGATLVLEPRFEAEQTLALIEKHRVTHAYLVPTMYQRLLNLDPSVRQRHDLSSLQHVASTGSPCPVPLKQAMIDWLGPIITEAYGSSEAGYTTFIDSATWAHQPGSAGRPLPDARVHILDDEGRPKPNGEIGLIYVRQQAMPDFTYINRPEDRHAIERDGLITLGDMGYINEEGFLYICDRKADMVISGGVNVYPAEIEAALLTMPGVADCAVFGIPDPEFGEGLAAAVQPRTGFEITPSEVQAFLRDRIANYKVPRVVDMHTTLPREDSGKIFKRLLREPYWRDQTRAI